MIKPELYLKTVGILYDAYFNDTLEHTNCCACAVGNLVGANCGYGKLVSPGLGIKRYWPDAPYPGKDGWARVFITESELTGRQNVWPSLYNGLAKEQIDSTGYTWQELAKIEYAFETAPKGHNDEDWMFNGLVAVLEVLKDIHRVTDEDLLQSNNKRFKDHYNTRVGATV